MRSHKSKTESVSVQIKELRPREEDTKDLCPCSKIAKILIIAIKENVQEVDVGLGDKQPYFL